MNSSTTVTKIASALLKAQKEMGDVSKTARNPFYKSSYADLNSIREVVTPALNNVGVSVLQPTITLGDKNFVETILLHESGEFISGITEIKDGEGKKVIESRYTKDGKDVIETRTVESTPQSEGSGISYARRYGLQSMLNVGAVDDDGEAAQGRKSDNKIVGTGTTIRTESVAAGLATAPGTATKIERPVKELITEAFKNLEAQKKISLTQFKTNYLGGKGLSTVLPSELPGIYDKIKKDFYSHTNGGSK